VSAAWVTGVYARTRRDYVASVLTRAATAERERDQQALLATAAERARISREMHDIVAHSLSVVIALSDGAAASVRRDPDAAQDAARQASTVARQALGEVRRLLGALHQTTEDKLLPAPGLAQLDDLADSVRAAGLAVDLTIEGQPLAVPPAAQLTVYRMVQEALTNVLKHAPEAHRASVRLRYGPSDIGVEVVNDGEVGTPPFGDGRGLSGMRERAAIFEGIVEASPRPQGGWRVTSRLRLDEATEVA
jgi:signal transduction histidine kinase